MLINVSYCVPIPRTTIFISYDVRILVCISHCANFQFSPPSTNDSHIPHIVCYTNLSFTAQVVCIPHPTPRHTSTFVRLVRLCKYVKSADAINRVSVAKYPWRLQPGDACTLFHCRN